MIHDDVCVRGGAHDCIRRSKSHRVRDGDVHAHGGAHARIHKNKSHRARDGGVRAHDDVHVHKSMFLYVYDCVRS